MRTLALMAVLCLVPLACAGPEKYTEVETLTEYPTNPYVYRVAPGDEIKVEVLQDPDYTHETTVLPDGSASFKWIGDMQVMDLTLGQTRELLREKLKPYFTSPTLTLQLMRINGPDPIVYLGNFGGIGATSGVTGQKATGGVIPYRKGIGLIEAIALAGGVGEPDIDVAPYIYVVRNIKSINERTVYRYDLAAAVYGNSPDLPLFPGDVVFMDQSWLQDLGRALGYVSNVASTATAGVSTALLVDVIADGK